MNKDFVRAKEQGPRGSIVAHQLLLATFDSYLKLSKTAGLVPGPNLKQGTIEDRCFSVAQ